jgi:hypothetical protein
MFIEEVIKLALTEMTCSKCFLFYLISIKAFVENCLVDKIKFCDYFFTIK